ncbi:MAG: hypothetical protein ABIP75_01545 [Pyrinomonadaceae bacterium]
MQVTEGRRRRIYRGDRLKLFEVQLLVQTLERSLFLPRTWSNLIQTLVLRMAVAIFCGALIGFAGGAINLTIVTCVTYPCSYAPVFPLFIGGSVGLWIGSIVRFLSGAVNRGWRSGMVIGLLAAVGASWLLSKRTGSDLDPLGPLEYTVTGIVWVAVGGLAAVSASGLFTKITLRPLSPAGAIWFGVIALFYLTILGYFAF